ncbi:MAG: hypothetical protein IT581_17855 [Verrucomicrobiales bacterium]|nr:hypothetical protein [Verrucomicrobiales bacterium]
MCFLLWCPAGNRDSLAAAAVDAEWSARTAIEALADSPLKRSEAALRYLVETGGLTHATVAEVLTNSSTVGASVSSRLLDLAESDDDARALLAMRALNQWSAASVAELARWASTAKTRHHERVAAQFRSLGGTVFLKGGVIVEVVLNSCRIVDTDLRGLRGLQEITDLSFERTPIGDAGLKHVAELHRLEWLNLFLTQVSDDGLAHLKKLRRLERLPIGGTRVTDAGLKTLSDLPSLKYLGLRGTRITDKGMPILDSMRGLTELNLGDTAVGDVGLEALRSLKSLRVLYLGSTAATDAGIARFSRALPDCQIQR